MARKPIIIVGLISAALVGLFPIGALGAESANAGEAPPESVAEVEAAESTVTGLGARLEQARWRAEPAPAPTLESGSKVLKALALCVGLFLIGSYLYRRMNGIPLKEGNQLLQVVERVPLSQKTSLLLVEVDGRRTLAAIGPDPVTLLDISKNEAVPQDEQKQFNSSLELACIDDLSASA